MDTIKNIMDVQPAVILDKWESPEIFDLSWLMTEADNLYIGEES